jgi:hypothetical protein
MRLTVGTMKLKTLLVLLIFTGCLDKASDQTVEKLSLQEIEQRINGAWKLKTLKTENGVTEFDINYDTLTYIEFGGLKGTQAELIDNHNGTYGTRSSDPSCELKEREGKKIIEYSLVFNDNWEKEIKSLSDKELILADSVRTWTYIRAHLESAD